MKRGGRMRFLLLALGVLVFPGAAGANIGFYVGTGAGWGFPDMDGEVMDLLKPKTGFALEFVHLGYNFSDFWGLNMQLGAVVGPGRDLLGRTTFYGQNYITFSLRYTFAPLGSTVPYAELGLGQYTFFMDGDAGDFNSDPTPGARLALGVNFYLGNIYLCPELSYHFVEYDEGYLSLYGWGDGPVRFKGRGDMLLLLFKIGHHFRV